MVFTKLSDVISALDSVNLSIHQQRIVIALLPHALP